MRGARLLWLLVVALSDAASAQPPRSEPPQARRRPPRRAAKAEEAPIPGSGRVVYATEKRLYLDRGAGHGLSAGQKVSLVRRGRAVGACEVQAVGPTTATCVGRGQVGDTFAARPLAAKPPPKPAAPAPSSERLTGLSEQVAQLSQPMVQSEAAGRVLARRLDFELWLSHQTWAAASAAVGPYQLERLDVSMRDAEVGVLGLSLSVDATARRWSRTPADSRYAGSQTQLLVRQAEVAARGRGLWLVLSAGRIWPFHAPGMGSFDGLQVGWRSADGGAEVGLLAGARPEALSLAPSLSRPLLGAYLGLSRANVGDFVRRVQGDARVAVLSGQEASTRLELEGALGAWGRRGSDVGVQVRGALDGGQARLEAARLSFGARPHDSLRLGGGLRYSNGWFTELLELGSSRPDLRAFHADALAAYDVTPWLTAQLQAGYLNDVASGLSRTFLGPELVLPSLLSSSTGLCVGYQQELGWLSGRSAYVQVTTRPLSQLRLLARLSYLEDSWTPGAAPSRDAGGYVSVDVRLFSWLWVRASALGRQGLSAPEERRGQTSGLSAQGSLVGEL